MSPAAEHYLVKPWILIWMWVSAEYLMGFEKATHSIWLCLSVCVCVYLCECVYISLYILFFLTVWRISQEEVQFEAVMVEEKPSREAGWSERPEK